MGAFVDLTGRRFGALRVVVRAPNHVTPNGTQQTRWECVCDCGGVSRPGAPALLDGRTVSCGCFGRQRRAESVRTHMQSGGSSKGKSGSYSTWSGMLTRCRNRNSSKFSSYGGRGISVCDRWLSFEAFFADMGERPVGMSLDRIDNGGNYSPDNCRWATPVQQRRNARHMTAITFDGRTLCLTDWERETGIGQRTLRARLVRGWSVADAFTRPV